MMFNFGNYSIIEINDSLFETVILIDQINFNKTLVNLFQLEPQKMLYIPFYYSGRQTRWLEIKS